MKSVPFVHISIFLSIVLLPVSFAWGQKKDLREVSAHIEVLMEGNYSKAEIEAKAVQAAQIQALGEAFGYAIIQGVNTQTQNRVGSEGVMTSEQMTAVSNTLVKGEWVSNHKNYPKLRYALRDKDEGQEIWLICEVKGKARAIEQADIFFETFAYNCEEPRKCNSGQFKNHDSMYLYFRSPVKGYLSVFMLEDGFVYRLLPYAGMKDDYESHVPVESDKEYFLFSPEHRDYFDGYPIVDEYGLVTYEDGQPLSNLIYVIFSTEPFRKPVLEENEGIKSIELALFQNWLNRNRGLDKNFIVRKFGITVNE